MEVGGWAGGLGISGAYSKVSFQGPLGAQSKDGDCFSLAHPLYSSLVSSCRPSTLHSWTWWWESSIHPYPPVGVYEWERCVRTSISLAGKGLYWGRASGARPPVPPSPAGSLSSSSIIFSSTRAGSMTMPVSSSPAMLLGSVGVGGWVGGWVEGRGEVEMGLGVGEGGDERCFGAAM